MLHPQTAAPLGSQRALWGRGSSYRCGLTTVWALLQYKEALAFIYKNCIINGTAQAAGGMQEGLIMSAFLHGSFKGCAEPWVKSKVVFDTDSGLNEPVEQSNSAGDKTLAWISK